MHRDYNNSLLLLECSCQWNVSLFIDLEEKEEICLIIVEIKLYLDCASWCIILELSKNTANPTKRYVVQQRLRSACVSMQFDQNLCWALYG